MNNDVIEDLTKEDETKVEKISLEKTIEETSKEVTRAEYKKKQEQELQNYKIGERDINGNLITKVLGRGDEFVVYEIETKDLVDCLKVHIKTKIEEDTLPIDNFNDVRTKFSEAKGLLYKAVDKTATKLAIAQIVIHAIRGKSEAANYQFENLIKQLHLEYREQFNNRMRMLASALVLTVLAVLFSVATYYLHYFKENQYIHDLVFIITGGCIGGVFSISIGLNKLTCEMDVNRTLYFLYGVQRITISILASVIVFFVIKADLAFGICKKMDTPVIGYVFFAILAGFSETLVPNLLSNIEKQKAT